MNTMAEKYTGKKNEVQYFDSDFSFEEHAAEHQDQWSNNITGAQTTHLSENDDDLLPQSQSKFWDAFHTNHSAGNFYKPRRYLTKSFPCILNYFNTNTTTEQHYGDGHQDNRILLEIGCGSGSSCIPIIKQCSEVQSEEENDGDSNKRILLACDSSSIAVDTTRRYIAKFVEKETESDTTEIDKVPCCNDNRILFDAFVADPSLSSEETEVTFLHEVKTAYEQLISKDTHRNIMFEDGIAGIVLMIFVFSAVTPTRVNRFLQQVYQTTRPGGKVCFRDYGMFDMPMLRFDATAACQSESDDPVFLRGEGTIARFFSVETTKELFEHAGFTTLELRYCTVFNNNRKTGQKLKRVFVHGVFEKPI